MLRPPRIQFRRVIGPGAVRRNPVGEIPVRLGTLDLVYVHNERFARSLYVRTLVLLEYTDKLVRSGASAEFWRSLATIKRAVVLLFEYAAQPLPRDFGYEWFGERIDTLNRLSFSGIEREPYAQLWARVTDALYRGLAQGLAWRGPEISAPWPSARSLLYLEPLLTDLEYPPSLAQDNRERVRRAWIECEACLVERAALVALYALVKRRIDEGVLIVEPRELVSGRFVQDDLEELAREEIRSELGEYVSGETLALLEPDAYQELVEYASDRGVTHFAEAAANGVPPQQHIRSAFV